MAKERNGKNLLILALLIVVVSMSVGFALLSTTLNINGTAKVKSSTWDVHFNNLNVKTGSVSGDNVATAATISSTNTTLVSYEVTLAKPGDYYEFTVDVVNDGSLDALVSAQPILGGVNSDQDKYVNYSITYDDGTAISANDTLDAGVTKTYKVRVEYDSNVSSVDLPTTDQNLSLTFAVTYQQA